MARRAGRVGPNDPCSCGSGVKSSSPSATARPSWSGSGICPGPTSMSAKEVAGGSPLLLARSVSVPPGAFVLGVWLLLVAATAVRAGGTDSWLDPPPMPLLQLPPGRAIGRRIAMPQGIQAFADSDQSPHLLVRMLFSPDGSRLAVIAGGSTRILDTGTGSTLLEAELAPQAIGFTEAGKILGVTTPDPPAGPTRVIDLATGKVALELPAPLGVFRGFTRDGRWVLLADEERQPGPRGTWIHDVEGRVPRRRTGIGSSTWLLADAALVESRVGLRADDLPVEERGDLVISDPASGRVLGYLAGSEGSRFGSLWGGSTDGRALLFYGSGPPPRDVRIVRPDPDGGPVQDLPLDLPDEITWLWGSSLGGRWLAAFLRGGQLALIPLPSEGAIAPQKSALLLAPSSPRFLTAALDPSGRWLAACSRGGQLLLWSLSALDPRPPAAKPAR